MYKIRFENLGSLAIHFIGIGGISMSGLAELMLHEGASVSGSDTAPSELTEKLARAGARIGYPQKAANIPEETDVIVATAAIGPDNPELVEAKKRGLPLLTRAELLGQVMSCYHLPIAVSGTHGKTTTTSMISMILLEAGLDPTVSLGGNLAPLGGNFRIGSEDYFVMEACEYKNSFLSFCPRIALILNVDADHLDFFKDIEDIRSSFRKFADKLPPEGTLIISRDIDRFEELISGLSCRIVTFGVHPDADYRPEQISYDELARASFVLKRGSHAGELRLSLGVPGRHNVLNAAAAVAAIDQAGSIPDDRIQAALLSFSGTDRRFQKKGSFGGVTVIDDYSHHPTEIRAALTTAANYPHRRIWCVFQPHTYSRTKALFHDFAEALCLADEIVLADIYAARETDDLGISSKLLAEEVSRLGGSCRYFPSFEEIENFLRANCVNGDLLITMGAGNITKLGDSLLQTR